jgi:hypothetical protein
LGEPLTAPSNGSTEKAVTVAAETRQQAPEHAQHGTLAPTRRGPGRPPKMTPRLAQATQEVAAARHACQRLAQQREKVGQSLRAIGHLSHCVALERGVRRHGTRMASDRHQQIDTVCASAPQEGLSQACLERREQAARVVPKMRATTEFVSPYVRPQVNQLDLRQPEAYAMHAHLIPSYSLERVAATRQGRDGQPLRALAERLQTPLFEPDGVLSAVPSSAQERLKHKAATLAEVFQRSSSNVEGRNGYLSLRNHALRGLANPRKRACLTAVHNFLIQRPDGTTAAERFFGQKPRSMFAALLASVEIPPAPLSPPRRAIG